MGMYTELIFKAEIRGDIPNEVRAVLHHLFNDGEAPTTLPDHEFFKCDRWGMVGKCSSFYHVPFALSRYTDGYIFSRSDLKDYDDEIRKFVDWVMPYIRAEEGACIGWSWYEEADLPTLLFFHDAGGGA